MIYALSAIGLLIGFLIWIWIWSMCRIAAKYDENFEPINQREEPIAQHDRTGTDELGLSDLTPVVGPRGSTTTIPSRRLSVSRPSPTTPASAIAAPITRSISTAT